MRAIPSTAERRSLLVVMALALLVRLATLSNPSSYFPDEIFQYLDVAHTQVFGYGVETWEQRYNIRSPILPLVLAIPMSIGKWISPDGFAFLYATKVVLAFLSLGIVWGSYRIGRILSPTHGLLAGFVAAIWFEFVYFSTQALTESVALSAFFPAAALLLDKANSTRRSVALGGFLLALTALLRFQYGPALVIFGALVCGRDKVRWVAASSGAAAAIALSMVIDISQGLTPFSWFFANYHHNITLGRSYAWTDGPEFYFLVIPLTLGPVLMAQIIPAWIGGRIFLPLALCGLANVAVHTLIAHKEYRYVLLTTAILILLAAIGSVELLKHQRVAKWSRIHVGLFLAALWLGGSILSGAFGRGSQIWSIHRAELILFQTLHRDPDACGVAIYNHHWSKTGGYSYLHRRIPIYVLEENVQAEQLRASSPAYNRLIAPDAGPSLASQFIRKKCEGNRSAQNKRLCIYERPGPCNRAVAPDLEINSWLKQRDI